MFLPTKRSTEDHAPTQTGLTMRDSRLSMDNNRLSDRVSNNESEIDRLFSSLMNVQREEANRIAVDIRVYGCLSPPMEPTIDGGSVNTTRPDMLKRQKSPADQS